MKFKENSPEVIELIRHDKAILKNHGIDLKQIADSLERLVIKGNKEVESIRKTWENPEYKFLANQGLLKETPPKIKEILGIRERYDISVYFPDLIKEGFSYLLPHAFWSTYLVCPICSKEFNWNVGVLHEASLKDYERLECKLVQLGGIGSVSQMFEENAAAIGENDPTIKLYRKILAATKTGRDIFYAPVSHWRTFVIWFKGITF